MPIATEIGSRAFPHPTRDVPHPRLEVAASAELAVSEGRRRRLRSAVVARNELSSNVSAGMRCDACLIRAAEVARYGTCDGLTRMRLEVTERRTRINLEAEDVALRGDLQVDSGDGQNERL